MNPLDDTATNEALRPDRLRLAWQRLQRQLLGRAGPAPGVESERRESRDRRTHSFRSFVYGSFRPRRRVSRRTGDEDQIFLDWHEPRVLYLVLGIVLMSCADALFTLNLLAAGGEELNAAMRVLIVTDTRHFLWVKIGMTGACAVLLALAARRRFFGKIRIIRFLQLFCAAYAALIVYELWLLRGHFALLWGATDHI
jgi:hypothetical protein